MDLFDGSRKIKVVYKNGAEDRIAPSLLTRLIDLQEVARFHRAEGWVTIGIDRIRGMGGLAYLGEDRRPA
ncbi:MAG: hypothetical protein RQ754_06605 [Desulfuromonadales bacterium]|nr:hypothetical protein [Desulfuromonadales bacterium]